jgi:hypothetical protein
MRLRPRPQAVRAGELTTGKNKTSGKIEKSIDAFLAFPLEAAFHIHPLQ